MCCEIWDCCLITSFFLSFSFMIHQGCSDVLILWIRNTADILFVLGYCVIAFLKLCFLGILRYEIKEMIQKIKLLQTEMAQAILNAEMGEPQLQQVRQMEWKKTTFHPTQNIINLKLKIVYKCHFENPQIPINGGIHSGIEPKVGNRDREMTRIGSADSERESLLHHPETTPQFTKQLYACMNEHGGRCGGPHQGVGNGCDSDTNSNCALIVDDMNTATTSTSATTKTINGNGNNNYELSEFDTKTSTYRWANILILCHLFAPHTKHSIIVVRRTL